MRLRKVQLAAVAAIAAASLALVGCSGDTSPGAANGAEIGEDTAYPAEMTKITVAQTATSQLVAMHLGKDKGFFEDRNLDVEFVEIPGQDVIVPSLLSGEITFANLNQVSLAAAVGDGLPVGWVTNVYNTPAELDEEYTGIYVRPDSGIESFADLEGKTIAVNCNGCIGELQRRAAIDAAGGDSSTVNFVVMQGPAALPALEEGHIDAAAFTGGLLQQATDAGLVNLGDHVTAVAPQQPIIPYATNTEWADQNPEVIKAFVDAVNESVEYAAANTDEVRAALPVYYANQVPDAVAAETTYLLPFESCLNEEAVSIILDYSKQYGYVPESVTADQLYYSGLEPQFC